MALSWLFRDTIADQAKIVSQLVSDGEEACGGLGDLCLATGRPSHARGSGTAPYLYGLAEGVGDQAFVVNRLRHDDLKDAEAILNRMDAIAILVNSTTRRISGAERRLDTVRGVIEDSPRSHDGAQNRLISALRLQARVGRSPRREQRSPASTVELEAGPCDGILALWSGAEGARHISTSWCRWG